MIGEVDQSERPRRQHGIEHPGEALREFAKGRVAAYKYPRNVWIVDELPKGPTGKILRREISAPEDALS